MNTLLPEQVFSEGGGSLLGFREYREGAGKLGLQDALDAGVLELRGGEEEGSGSPSSWPESLDPEPASSNKLRVLLTGETSPAASLTGLEKQKSRDIRSSNHKHGIILCG